MESLLLAVLEKERIKHRVLSMAEVDAVLTAIESRFCEGRWHPHALWQGIKNKTSYYQEAGPPQVHRILSAVTSGVTLVVNDYPHCSGLEFLNGQELLSLFDAADYSFIWYATDLNLSFLLCENDHDFVIYTKGGSESK